MHTMHFTPVPVLNCGVSSTPSGVILTHLTHMLTLFGVMFKLLRVVLAPQGVVAVVWEHQLVPFLTRFCSVHVYT